MKNWTIKKLMRVGFALPLLAIIIMGLGAVGQFRNIEARMIMLADTDTPLLMTLESIKAGALMNRRYEKDFFINIGNPEKQAKYLLKYAEQKEKTLNCAKEIQALIAGDEELSPETNRLARQLTTDLNGYFNLFSAIADKVSGDPAITTLQANKLLGPAKDNIHNFDTYTILCCWLENITIY